MSELEHDTTVALLAIRVSADWQAGHELAIELRFTPALREAMLRSASMWWPDDYRDGFIEGHSHWLAELACCCRCCAVHADLTANEIEGLERGVRRVMAMGRN